MCGRYTVKVDAGQLARRFHVAAPELPLSPDLPRYNAAPTQQLPVVVRHDAANQLRVMRWGLVPHWAKDDTGGARMINARAETLLERPSYRPLVRSRRCLVPASGFYEWQPATKQPYFIHLREREVFAFAGLYDRWRNREGEELATYTIITTAPNDLMGTIHNRMPVILRPEDEEEWLDTETTEREPVLALLRAYPAEEMEAYPVSRAVNSPRNEGAQLVERVSA
jgi:putative SOS response-associated peptidase YedK